MAASGEAISSGSPGELTFAVRVDWLESGEKAGRKPAPPAGRRCRLPGCSIVLEESDGVGRPTEWCDRKHSDLFYWRRNRLDAALEEVAALGAKLGQLTRDQARVLSRRQRLLAEARACYVLASELPLARTDQSNRLPWLDAIVMNQRMVENPDRKVCPTCQGREFIDRIPPGSGQLLASHALGGALYMLVNANPAIAETDWFKEAAKRADIPMEMVNIWTR